MQWRLGAFLLVVFGSLSSWMTVQAESVDYQVSAQLPANQVNRKVTYFDLKVKPQQQQTLKLKVTNQSKQTRKFNISVNSAGTNSNGVINYGQGIEPDTSLKYSLNQLVQAPKVISVPGHKSRVVKLRLTAPTKRFKGILLGGVTIQKQVASAKAKQGIALQNQFAYVTGIQLHSKPGKVMANLKLNKVHAKSMEGRSYVIAELQNPQSAIMHDLEIHATVSAMDSSKPFIETNKKQMTMAPNSNFKLPLSTEQHAMKPGKYTLDLTAKANQGKQHWHFKREFTVAEAQADELNKNVVSAQKTGPNWLLIGLGSLIGLLLMIIAWLVYKSRQLKSK